MERIIKVNGVEVVKGLCTIEFNIGCSIFDHASGITHGELYSLLDSATKIEDYKENDSSTAFVRFYQGNVVFIAYKKNSN